MVLRTSDYIRNQLPEFVREQYPKFLLFLQSYYQQQESKGNALDLIDNYINYFDLNYIEHGIRKKIVLSKTISKNSDEILCYDGEYLPKDGGYIRINDEIIYYTSLDIEDNLYKLQNCKRAQRYKFYLGGEFVSTNAAEHIEGSIINDISSLFLSSILTRYQNELMSTFPTQQIKDEVDQRQVLKYIKDFYTSKGTKSSLKFLFNVLLQTEDDELDRYAPRNFVYKVSNSSYTDFCGFYVRLIKGDLFSLEGKVLEQSAVKIVVNKIINQGKGIYFIGIDEGSYEGQADFTKNFTYNEEEIILQPISVLSKLETRNNNPYSSVGTKVEIKTRQIANPIGNVLEIYENNHNYFLENENKVYSFTKNPIPYQPWEVTTQTVGVYVDKTTIPSNVEKIIQYGHIEFIELLDKGFGYQNPPNVIVDYEENVAFAILTGDVIDRIELNLENQRNYLSSPPSIEITTGRGASASAVITNGKVTSLTLDEGGIYYTEPPRVVIQDLNGRGRDAIYQSIIENGSVVGFEKFSEGILYSDATEVFLISAANDSQAKASAKLSTFRKIRSFSFSNLATIDDRNFKDTMLSRSDNLHHSPIIGFSYDGYPIYGPYGYSSPTVKDSEVVLMQSGWRLKPEYSFRPNVKYGELVEDYEYIHGLNHLDPYNGRFCVTPEYPDGTYAYFLTMKYTPNAVDRLYHKFVYPYIIGNYFYSRAAPQFSELKLSQISNLKKLEPSVDIEDFKAVVSKVSLGTIDGFTIGHSADKFKIENIIRFENEKNLTATVSAIDKRGIGSVIFERGVFVELDRGLYANGLYIFTQFENNISVRSIWVAKNVRGQRSILTFIIGERHPQPGDTFNNFGTVSSLTVWAKLRLNGESNFKKGSVLTLYGVDGTERMYQVIVEESIVEADELVVAIESPYNVSESFFRDYTGNKGEENNLADESNLEQARIEMNNLFGDTPFIVSGDEEDSIGRQIISYEDLTHNQFKIVNVSTTSAQIQFENGHDFQIGDVIKLEGPTTINHIVTVRPTINRDFYFNKGVTYIFRGEEIEFLDISTLENNREYEVISEVQRIENTSSFIIKFDENTNYDCLYYFDRSEFPSINPGKIYVVESPFANNLTVVDVSDSSIFVIIDVETRDFPTFETENMTEEEIFQYINGEIEFTNQSFLNYTEAHITKINTRPNSIGSINEVNILNGNSNLSKLPKVIGVENQAITYKIDNSDERTLIYDIDHEISFSKPIVYAYDGDEYINPNNFTIHTRNNRINYISSDYRVKNNLEIKILESDVEIFPYSNSIGKIETIDISKNSYDVSEDIDNYPTIQTSNIYELEDNNTFVLNERVHKRNQKETNSYVSNFQGNNLIEIYNSDFNIGDEIVGTISNRVHKIIKVWNSDFNPIIQNELTLIENFSNQETGYASAITQKLQDGKKYQDYSYVIRSLYPIEDWKSYVENTIHPAGYELYGELLAKSDYQAKTEFNDLHYEFTYKYEIEIDVSFDICSNSYIHHDLDLNLMRGKGVISSNHNIDTLSMERVYVNQNNQVVSEYGYSVYNKFYFAILYTIDGVFNNIVEYKTKDFPQTLPLKNFSTNHVFYGLGFLDNNENHHQKLKNIFQRSQQWLDAANLVETNVASLLKWIGEEEKITSKSYYNNDTLDIFVEFNSAIGFALRFGGNNKVKDIIDNNREIDVFDLIIDHIKTYFENNDIINFVDSLLIKEIKYPDYINDETKQFDLLWDDGTEVVLNRNEDLFIFVDGFLQIPNQSYTIGKYENRSEIIFKEPLKWKQSNAEKTSYGDENISMFMGYNLAPYEILDLQKTTDGYIFINPLTNVRQQINCPLCILLFIDGVLQEYETIYTINNSLLRFSSGIVIEDRDIHIRYLYKNDIDFNHNIHNYWDDAYYSTATIEFSTNDSLDEFVQFINNNNNVEIRKYDESQEYDVSEEYVFLDKIYIKNLGKLKKVTIEQTKYTNKIKLEVAANKNLEFRTNPESKTSSDFMDLEFILDNKQDQIITI